MTPLAQTLEETLEHLQTLVEDNLHLWALPPGATARLINVSENATYLIDAPSDFKAVLRVHRPEYHSRRAIECELLWLDALRKEDCIQTPEYFEGTNGSPIQTADHPNLDQPRFMVLFQFVEGSSPEAGPNMNADFFGLGATAAKCHDHVLQWQKPAPFERLTWDVDSVFGEHPTWGNWRDAPNVTSSIGTVLEKVEATIRIRLDAFGKSRARYNLIHADMRLANLLVHNNSTRVIDFDDCGMGWFMYDFAAAISFIEDDPRIPELKSAWLEGYRSVRELSRDDEAEIDTFVMLRRMALLAWIGSHIEAPEPQALAPDFARVTAELGQKYLDRFGV